ncbi:MAG: helix-turn-helix transcriptional regulator [Ignavibacteriaceae bacterium]|nr:helix-turn-helix transcriptional regulator [Ignavibacteriaceae bacterium]
MRLQNNLKKLRFEKNQVSQEVLAKAVNVSRQTINSIENGKFNPSVVLALQISKFFEKKIEEVFYLEE